MSTSFGDPKPATGRPLLQIAGLSKTFPSQQALQGLDLTIGRGEIHALLGQNGSGKSTLIKILAGYHQPDPGASATLGGSALTLGSPVAARAAGLRFIHQDLGLINELDAVDNLALGQHYGGGLWLSDRRERRRVTDTLRRYEIDIDVSAPIRTLSAAQRSQLAVVRALTQEQPQDGLLVLDEATATLPESDVRVLFSLLRALRDQGNSILFVTHRLPEVFQLADSVTVLRDGRRVTTLPVADVDHDQLVELIIGKPLDTFYPSPPPPRLKVALTASGVRGGAVAGIDLSVHEGEIVGVTGLIGSGYDELLGLLFGARRRDAGAVQVNGDAIRPSHIADAISKGIGYVPADRKTLGSIPAWSVRENTTLSQIPTRGPLKWLSNRHERRDTNGVLARLNVVPAGAERPLSTLSGGNQQKVMLARWLRCSPAVLLLDEPTNGVDTGAKQAIYQALADAAASSAAVVLASSDIEELCAVCDRVLVVRGGRLAAELSGADLTEARVLQETLARDTDLTLPRSA